MSNLRIHGLFAIFVLLSCAAWYWPGAFRSSQTSVNVAMSNPNPCTDAEFGETCIPNQSPLMLTEYLACSSKAESQILNQSEAIACLQAYLAVKLSFISGVGLENYPIIPQEQRVEINRRAFKAYRKWRVENPSLVITPPAKPEATLTSI